MRVLTMIFIVFSSFFSHAADRFEKHEQAVGEFLDLHFFEDGRGMHLTPGLVELIDREAGEDVNGGGFKKVFERRYGFNVVDNNVIGLFSVPYKKRDVAVIGCVACHSGKAAGYFIPGLGNKNIDVVRIAKDALRIQKLLKPIYGGKEYKEVRDSAIQFAKDLADDRFGNLTQGLVTISFIRRWFYRQGGLEMPDDVRRGAVKIPFLWGYGVKRFVGQFSDGFGNGALPGWAVAVELAAGQTVETVRKYLPKVDHAETILGDLLPPPYPFPIDRPLASHGEQVFVKTCSRCHGTYIRDNQGLPVYEEPKWIPWSVVKTDNDRLQTSQQFIDLVKTNPLNDIIQSTGLSDGYFAPRLEAIWSRFPYLHNASVPSIYDMLTPPEQRPQVFSLLRSGERDRFSEQLLGLTRPEAGSKEELKLLKKARTGARDVYWTYREGQTAVGHPFGTSLPNDDKLALIEYLKTL